MGEVFSICEANKKFTLEEAEDMIPMLKRISNNCDKVIEKLLAEQRYYIKCDAPKVRIDNIDVQIAEELQRWGGKVARLGIRLFNGQYLFNNGTGYWSWYKSEDKITNYINYGEDPSNRRPLSLLGMVNE